MSQPNSLEQQLEMLFSDAVLPASISKAIPRKAPDQTQAASAPGIPRRPKARRPSQYQTQQRRGWLPGLVALGLVLVAALVLVERGMLAESVTTAEPQLSHNLPERAAFIVATPITRTAIPTSPGSDYSSPTFSILASTATLTQREEEATARPTASATATPVPPSPTATYTPSPTASPTLPPVRPVYTATTTPAPAYAMGLNSVPTPAARVPMPEGAITIALLGSDQRPHETQWRTDVIIVVSVNPELPSVSMLTIPRDTWLYIPNWTYQRINLADTHGAAVGYPGGGPGLVKAVIEYNFGIHVDYYARVNFAGLIHIVDTLGGVDVLLDCPVEDGFPDDPITEDPSVVTQISYPEPGLYHVDGKHALWLARSRKTTSEFARSRRQHRILQAIWVKANQRGVIQRLPDFWQELTDTVETDLCLEQVLWLASVGLKMDLSQVHSGFIDGRYLTAWVSPGGGNVLLPDIAAIQKAIEPLFNPYPYKAPQGFNKIEVWNGSGHENWGLLAADKLMRHGFTVTDIQAADKVYENSMILDFTATRKGSPLPLLQELLEAQVAHLSPAEAKASPDVSFRFVVGADYAPCEWPTPARWTPPTPGTDE